jgi:MoaA/NifB/PqqE/SkfB family radical SAM enzyme
MFLYKDIKQVHLEPTSRCNARCPQCPRNFNGGVTNPALPLAEIDLAKARALFPPEFVTQLTELFMCGNYGDPIVATDTLPIFTYLRSHNGSMKLAMHTNGSGRDTNWWQALAAAGVKVRFGIDGLHDTNAIYRRGTNWQHIMKNVEAFIAAGGKAEWCFIVFRHNEHQVEEAEDLSHRMGFSRFIIKRTKRFHIQNKGEKLARTPVFGLQGEFEYYIEPPQNPKYQLTSDIGPVAPDQSYEDHLLTTAIDCLAAKQKMIYVSAKGLVLPCCWLGDIYPGEGSFKARQIRRLIDQLPEGEDSINGLVKGVRQVVEGPFFQQYVPACWAPARDKNHRLLICATTCGRGNLVQQQIARSGGK